MSRCVPMIYGGFNRVELKKLRITKCNIYRKISLSRLPVTIKLLSFTLLTILISFVKRNLSFVQQWNVSTNTEFL